MEKMRDQPLEVVILENAIPDRKNAPARINGG